MGDGSEGRDDASSCARRAGAGCPRDGQCKGESVPGDGPWMTYRGPISEKDLTALAEQIAAARGAGGCAFEERTCESCGEPFIAIHDPELAEALAAMLGVDDEGWLN